MTSVMIRPALPHFYEIDFANKLSFFISSAVILLSVVITAFLFGRYAAGKFGGNKQKAALCFAGISVLMTVLLVCFFGCSAFTVKGIILCLILVFSSYEDIQIRKCDNFLPLMTVIAAFIGTDLSSVPNMFLSAIFAGGLMLLTIFVTKCKVGGGDIKTAAACSFLLGLNRGISGMLAGMILALIINIFKKDKSKGFPLIPYLAAGYLAAYFIVI